jgi:hypothetical protein
MAKHENVEEEFDLRRDKLDILLEEEAQISRKPVKKRITSGKAYQQ